MAIRSLVSSISRVRFVVTTSVMNLCMKQKENNAIKCHVCESHTRPLTTTENSVWHNRPLIFHTTTFPYNHNKKLSLTLQAINVSPIIPSEPKCSSRHLSSIECAYVLSNPFPSKPLIVFSPHKPLHSQPSDSSGWLGIFLGVYF